MKKVYSIFFKKALLVFPFCLLLFISCHKHTEDEYTPPCICPPDFSFTDGEPAWSPDGKYIAFMHGDSVGVKTGIYLITPDGKENRLWHAGINAGAPAWSPDGQWIAFNDGTQIWKKKLNGDSLTQLTFEGRNFYPAWSPDGQWIAYDNTDCGSAVTPPEKNSCGILFINPIIPKKVWIVKGRTPEWINNGSFIYLGLNEDIYSFRISDSSIKRIGFLSDEKAYGVRYPKYSPQRNQIIFTAQFPGIAFPRIYIINADGSNLKQLTDVQSYSCDWSPDGSKIVYTDSRPSNGRLWIMNAYGTNKQQLTFPTSF